jgi:hypothetical protein
MHPSLIYRLISVVHKIDDLPEFSDLGVWSYHCEKSPEPRSTHLNDRRHEPQKPPKRKRKQTEPFVSTEVPEAMEGEETERKEPT